MNSVTRSFVALMARKYVLWGRDVTIKHPHTGRDLTLRMVDLTRGIEVGDGDAQVSTVLPSASVRACDLSSSEIDAHDMIGQAITLNGVEWTINSHAPKDNPHGPENGEIYFMLVNANA